ncbi:MAG: helix-turn-helix domain-containing protein [Oscillospiraceae bacterium]|nr:helix-turn-helix domain-containing protein [Oscillospiraceae bacterium]
MRYRLMIVDPDRGICENIPYLLDWSQYGVSGILTANSYEEAVSRAVDFQPHIALVELELGDRQGYELVRHLRETGLETVFCTMGDKEDFQWVQQSMRAGARDYLLKPLDTSELRSFLERAVLRELGGSLPERPAVQTGLDPVLHTEYGKLSRITNKIILIVKSNYRRGLSLTGIAEMLNMSSKYIGRVFLQDTGMKFSAYLTAYRMIQARRLIENSQEKISVVASMVGYSQLNNFYVHFKNYFRISPGALRDYGGSHLDELTGGLEIEDAGALSEEAEGLK